MDVVNVIQSAGVVHNKMFLTSWELIQARFTSAQDLHAFDNSNMNTVFYVKGVHTSTVFF